VSPPEAGPATRTGALPLGLALREPPPAGLGGTLGTRVVVELAALAERLGYHSVWIPEGQGREVFSLLGAVAMATERIGLATGVLPVFSRPPGLAAMGLATVDDLSNGRVICGVGAGHAELSGHVYAIPYRRPVTAVREFVDVLRRVMRGGTVCFEGRVFRVNGFALESVPARAVPVYVAALRGRMLSLAGEVGDGVLLNWATVARVPVAVEAVRRAAWMAGRTSPVRVACFIRACVTDRPEPAREALRRLIASYASLHTYRALWACSGFAEEMSRAEQAVRSGVEAVVQAISDRMVEALGLIGSARQVQRRLREFYEAGVEVPIVYPFAAGPGARAYRETIEALAERSGN